MNSKILCIVVVLFIGVMITPSYAFNPKTVDWNKCAYGGCFEYKQTNPSMPKLSIGQNVQFNVLMPDFTCNITGQTNPSDGSCNAKSLIVSSGNWTNTMQDVAAMTVRDIQSTSNPVNSNFCPLAYFTVTHEDGYFYIIQNVLDKVFPNYCYQELGSVTIPEFPQTMGIVLAIAVLSLIVFTANGMRKK